ncbi:hypothetical protein D6783_01765 [Candidatus Woesearchaeota archaeon]|nr:MAG: hypothetical protein D6783_01765 [Candidatus Woesearchaeota archaeon]
MMIPDDQKFYFRHGKTAASLEELLQIIEGLDEHDFVHHVHEGRNDFANWVRHVLRNEDVARQLEQAHSKEQVLSVLREARGNAGSGQGGEGDQGTVAGEEVVFEPEGSPEGESLQSPFQDSAERAHQVEEQGDQGLRVPYASQEEDLVQDASLKETKGNGGNDQARGAADPHASAAKKDTKKKVKLWLALCLLFLIGVGLGAVIGWYVTGVVRCTP